MSWFVGQQVGVLHEAGVFTIKKIEHAQLILEDESGFEYTYNTNVVVLRHAIPTKNLPAKDLKSSTQKTRQPGQSSKTTPLPCIDLHAENLCLPIGMGIHEILLAQLLAFKRFCNEQAKHRKTKFLVIHGAGEGRLKQEIRILVNGRAGMRMHDAQWSNGSVGASRIELLLQQFEPF